MGDNADLTLHEALRGEEWRGCFRNRVGDYRIIYQMDLATREMVILKVGHRRGVYR